MNFAFMCITFFYTTFIFEQTKFVLNRTTARYIACLYQIWNMYMGKLNIVVLGGTKLSCWTQVAGDSK